MRPLWKDILIAAWLGLLLPGILLQTFVLMDRRSQRQLPPEPDREILQSGFFLPVQDPEGNRNLMELETYLTGVLLAEMPARFHPEALKAQAVAARTYTWKTHTTGSKHGEGVCMEPSCCQAYMEEQAYLSRGGTQEDLEKIRGAVVATSGFVISYEGELIEATYFSSSGGSTEAALSVWGADYPYLQSVSSPEESREDTVTFTAEEIRNLLGRNLPGSPEDWLGDVSYTGGGGVAYLDICGETYTGVALRSLLNLRSTAFQIRADDSSITVTTKGYGHRVGMSQYGADAMAEAGSTWQQILQHYYPGTVIHPIA